MNPHCHSGLHLAEYKLSHSLQNLGRNSDPMNFFKNNPYHLFNPSVFKNCYHATFPSPGCYSSGGWDTGPFFDKNMHDLARHIIWTVGWRQASKIPSNNPFSLRWHHWELAGETASRGMLGPLRVLLLSDSVHGMGGES